MNNETNVNKKSSGKKVAKGCGISFCVVALLFLALIVGIVASSDNEPSKDESTTTDTTIYVTAEKMLEDFTANEVSAKQTYDNQTIAVTGIVYSIGVDDFDSMYIVLDDGDDGWQTVRCYVKDTEEEKASKLTKGDKITIIGEYSSFTYDILMYSCVIDD